jgi:hypothetical protein
VRARKRALAKLTRVRPAIVPRHRSAITNSARFPQNCGGAIAANALARFLKKRLSSPAGVLTLSGLTDGAVSEP